MMDTDYSQIDSFAGKWNQNDSLGAATLNDIKKVEKELKIILPASYKYLMTKYGDIYTPDTLEVIVDNDIDLNDIQEFELPLKALESTKSWQEAGLPAGHFAFASDSMGNMFCFKNSECISESTEPPIWFYDHDFNEIERIADNFFSWLENYNEI